MSNEKRIIYGNGEYYVEPYKKSSGYGETKYPQSYEEARDGALEDIKKAEEKIKNTNNDDYLSDAVVLSVRLNEKFIAKSYYPEKLIEESPIEFVGSKCWVKNETTASKQLFIRMDRKNFNDFSNMFERPVSKLSKNWITDVQKVEEICLHEESDKLIAFDNWSKGRVELVLHPLGTHSDSALAKLMSRLKKLGVSKKEIRVAQYERGLTFVSAPLSKKTANAIGTFNPLRSAHPIGSISLPNLRVSKTANAPKPPNNQSPSPLKVGVFDGGTDPTNPLLLNHVTERSLTKEAINPSYISHGSAVAGATLYGPLNDYKALATLPSPTVSVDSFRVFPTSDPSDPELYEIIDSIEKVVTSRPDIKVYNISIGPIGPIVDDHIRRFTYALDRLAFKYDVLFFVACGNDGDQGEIAGRIQSPSDGINVMGIGAHSISINKSTGQVKETPAPYTCFGPGREGCKVKPDISAFGGCNNHPIALVSEKHGYLAHSMGTSFSSPIVSGYAAELMGRCNQLSPLSTRVLLINRSIGSLNEPHSQLGHGVTTSSCDEILSCSDKKVTITFNGSLSTKKYAKLPIPFVKDPHLKGKVNIRWTIGVLTKPDIENIEEYSTVCIEDTFVPHSHKYKFHPPESMKKAGIRSKTLDILHNKKDAQDLINAKWKKNKYPTPKTGASYKAPESARRNLLKWDTIVDRSVSMRANGVYEPYLAVHAMSRNEYADEFSEVTYGVVVTIDYPQYSGDLYAEIGKIYSKLQPLQVRPINQVLVNN